ncbi:MAG: hypothetical protein JST82_09305 [Bacteroidetes bacterium]|nr:hypothetical protein [Bacteroidota bacterium]
MKSRLLLIAAAVMIIASCRKSNESPIQSVQNAGTETETPAVSTSKSTKDCGKPFHGEMIYYFTNDFNLPCNCGTATPVGNLFGTGNLSHLGLSTSKIKPCSVPIMVGTNYIGDHIAVECGSFVAANGDELYCYTYPYDLMFGATAAVGTIHCDFVGGTGRFKHATGSFTGTITVSYTAPTATLTGITGTIDY